MILFGEENYPALGTKKHLILIGILLLNGKNVILRNY